MLICPEQERQLLLIDIVAYWRLLFVFSSLAVCPIRLTFYLSISSYAWRASWILWMLYRCAIELRFSCPLFSTEV
jgi:hypothetical protein